ncbi:MAG: hypothetical protein OEW75_01220 [Cyclobacteriaceae bacterium]|nr:hypothetical protein [Cyclobacteriaceae bacterium]
MNHLHYHYQQQQLLQQEEEVNPMWEKWDADYKEEMCRRSKVNKAIKHLKALLLHYITICYKDNAPPLITNNLLEKEYQRLESKHKLERLFEAEQLVGAR